MRPPARQQRRRQERERLEAKRQRILESLDPETRTQYEDTDVVTLICLRQSGALNMLPGMKDLG